MHVELKTYAVNVGEKLQSRIDCRMRFALGRFGDRIGRVVVLLRDLNGPEGGIDKSVRVLTRIDGVGLVVRWSSIATGTWPSTGPRTVSARTLPGR